MKYFDVRQSGDLASSAPWPQEAPALRLIELPTRLQVPLATTAPAIAPPMAPAVREAGSIVAKGQRLCDAGLAGSPAILAPTSGRIVGTSMAHLLNGSVVPAIDIEPDFEDRPIQGETHDAAHSLEHQELIEGLESVDGGDLAHWVDRLRNAGVWADRPTSPDLLAQLNHALRHPVDTLICNLLDDEPVLRLNSILAARSGPILLAGISLLAKLTEAKNVWVIVEAGAPGRWWSTLRRLARKARIEIVPVINDYPQSNPSLLLYHLLGRRLKPGRLPTEQRAFVLDAASAISVGRCASRDQAMLQVPVAVRDHTSQQSHFLVVPIGTSLRHVLKECETETENVTLRRGDVLRENDVSPEAVVSGADLTIHVMPRQVPPVADPCIRCSWCVESCPTRVQPAGLLEAAQRGDLELAAHYGLAGCIECGVCSYVCPSRLPLLLGIRKLKEDLRNQEPGHASQRTEFGSAEQH